MTIDINAAFEAGSKRRSSATWIDSLPADVRKSLEQLRDEYTQAVESGKPLMTLPIARNICQQLGEAGHPHPSPKRVSQWLKYQD
jgi:hypothetical protein